MAIDLEKEKEAYQLAWDELQEEYGDWTMIPKEDRFIISERLRAAYCLSTAGEVRNPVEVMKYYSIDRKVWDFFIDEVPEDMNKRVKRADKYQAILDWTQDKLFEQITPQDVMDVGEISYPTALKFISDNPHVFRKLKRGLYEIRDPKADREAEKV